MPVEREPIQVIENVSLEEVTPEATVQNVSSVDDFGPWAGWEFDFAVKHPVLYPLTRTAADLLPFGQFLFPSGQREFDNSSLLKQLALIGMDAMVVLPSGWIGKGLKVVGKTAVRAPLVPIEKGLKALNLAMKDVEKASPAVLDNVMRKLDEFVYRSPLSGLMTKYGLSEKEAKAVLRGEETVWESSGRSGGFVATKTENLQRLFKDGKLKKSIAKDIEHWSRPFEEQKLAFYKKEWSRYFGRLLGGGKYSTKDLFEGQVRRLFGEKAAKKLTIENISEKDFYKVLYDSLLNEGKILRHVDSTFGSYFLPVRKVAGAWEKMYGTYSKLYEPMKKRFTEARILSLENIKKFHLIQASKGIGKITKKGVFKEAYTGAEWREAGKLVRKLDDLQSAGVPQQVIQEEFAKATPMVQKIVKSYQEWTDYMYAEDVKLRIVRAFQKVGLTEEGKDGLETLLSPFGRKMNSYITEIFSASNNLSYEQKIRAFERVLEKLKEEASRHPYWFVDPSKDTFRELFSELSFRSGKSTKGIPSYLRNYGARLYEPGTSRYVRRISSAPAGTVTPGYVKERLLETGEGAIEDLGKLVAVRARQQAREAIINPIRPIWKAQIDQLPRNLRTYFNHYLSRLLGEASPVDEKVASYVNRLFGTYWTGQRIKDLAYTINDLVYLGGIGFKPFSALRNLLQPILLVPADLGGIKDSVWLIKGYQRGLSGQGMAYLRDIGAITEYAPDLLFSPQVSRFGKTFRFKGKEFTPPSLRRVRDAGMWMFKLSDRMNRYVAGGAALSKWEHYTKKFLSSEGGLRLTEESIGKFLKKLNLKTRDPWIRSEIVSKLKTFTREGFEEAKKIYVKDIVADTQFLYGVADSPLVTQLGGSITKNALVFQSWWMNYGAEFQKWVLRSGSVEESAQRFFAWMLSSAIIANMIEPVWGKQTARRTVFAGPFPLSIDIPPTWRPMRDGLNTIIAAAEAGMGISDLEHAKSRMLATLKSSMIYVPGGLQLAALERGYSREGFQGFLKEIIKYRPPKD